MRLSLHDITAGIKRILDMHLGVSLPATVIGLNVDLCTDLYMDLST